MIWVLALALAQDLDSEKEIARIKRVHVDRFTPGDGSEQIRDLLIAALQRSKLFIVTENAERADAFLRGGGEDSIFNEEFQFREGLNARVGAGLGRGTGVRSSGANAQAAASDDESQRLSERRHEALATVRLVNKDGDVLWAITKESRGSKVKAATVDLVERIVEQLKLDLTSARAAVK